jgi:hypothetical protein
MPAQMRPGQGPPSPWGPYWGAMHPHPFMGYGPRPPMDMQGIKHKFSLSNCTIGVPSSECIFSFDFYSLYMEVGTSCLSYCVYLEAIRCELVKLVLNLFGICLIYNC